MPIAPRFFVFLAALAASLTLDLLFFFGARGSSASFTLELFFDRGAGVGHEPPLTASARTGRGRAASAATVKAASSRAMARAMAPQRVSAALRVALLCAECHGKSRRCDSLLRPAGRCTASLHRLIVDIPRLTACWSVTRFTTSLEVKCVGLCCASVLQDAS